MRNTTTITVALLCSILPTFVFADEPPTEAPWTEEEVTLARHCVSEASGARTDDCRAITWISVHQAERRGISPQRFVETTYRRHTRSESRPWVGELSGDLAAPPSWPVESPWETRGLPAWLHTLRTVRAVMKGTIGHACDGTPLTWGGRMDHEGIGRWQERGYDRLDCGTTLNTFIGRRR